jgi:regulator of protease activity HflC (stomatin/prohibitin superfamily)
MAQALQSLYKFAVPLAVGASLAQASIYDVKGGTRAVIFDRLSGVKDQVVNEGTHFLVPWLQKSIIYDVRTKPRNISTTTGSKDLQMVSLTLRVLHRPDVQQLPKIYQVCFRFLYATGQDVNVDLESRSRLRRKSSPLHWQRSPQIHRGPIRRRRTHHAARSCLQPHPHRSP